MAISTRTRPDRNSAVTSLTIRDHLNTFFYYHKVAATTFLVVAVLGLILALTVPIPYRAQSTLLVLFAGYYDQSAGGRGGVPVAPAIGELVSVEAQILDSPELHREVVMARLGPNNTDPQVFDKQVREFESRFHLEQNDLANTLNLSYYDVDPKRAAATLEDLLARYFKQRATIFTSGRTAMLAGQRDQARSQLDRANAELLAFQQEHGVVNITDQISRAVALENLLVQRKMENEAALAQDRAGLAALQASTAHVKSDILLFNDNAEIARALATMQISLLDLQARRAEVASRYMDGSPFVQQLDKQIADLKANIARNKQQMISASRVGHNSYYDTVQDRLSGLLTTIAGQAARQKELEAQVAEARSRSESLISVAGKLRQMQADRDLLAENFNTAARLYEQVNIQQEQASKVNSTNVRVIQPPVTPSQRNISRGLLVAAALVAAVVISGLTVLLRATMRETFLSPEQIERSLLLSVLCAPITSRRAAPRGTAAPPPRRLTASVAHADYGRLASAIHFSSNAASKTVVMLAANDGEGMSRLMRGLALELSGRSARPVLVLDMTAAKSRPYGEPNAQGQIEWPDVEGAEQELIVYVAKPVLDLEFSQVSRQNIVVAWASDSTQQASWQYASGLFESLKRDYAYVLVHAPSSTRSFHGIENAARADAVVLVIQAENTRKPVAQTLKDQVLDSGGNIIGVAMTNRRAYIPGFFYRLFLNK